MVRPTHRPLRSRHMVDDLGQTAIIGGSDLITPLLQRIQRLQHRLACFIVRRNHDSLRTSRPLSLPTRPARPCRDWVKLLICQVGTTVTLAPEVGSCRNLAAYSFSYRHAVSIKLVVI